MKLKKGDQAPAFTGVNEKGETVTLDQFKGQKLVLYFYPKDDTPGCTAEACNLRDNYEALQAQGYAILGVSPDTEKKHQKFIEKYELPFSLLADTEHEIAEAYGAWGEKSMYGKKYMGILRSTFLIDANGVLEEVIAKVKTKEHAAQILS